MRSPRLAVSLALLAVAASAHAAEPRLLVDQPGFGLELVAREPDIVTPIAMAFDAKGRLLVIESHTHQRPADYDGPPGDRIRALEDSDRDGRLDRWSTFAEGFQQAMGLCVRPDGGVYLVTRRDVRLLEDTDGDGASDKETPILRLETDQSYPHNGMSGIALKPNSGAGILAIGIGENFGSPYTLIGSDGERFEMRDGAGNVFVCRADGAELRRMATGFWNPFALCYAGGNLYCVDNDPDASPPCRLIHVWRGGDYGFRFQYGRAGTHPLLAWNGELPGTLPTVCGVGEAPTAIVFHHGFLWVTSWGDHRVERYSATETGHPDRPARGGRMQVVVQGDVDFRPTGCAVAPDGSLYFADWVDRSYPVHGRGRIWRLALPMAENDQPIPATLLSHGGAFIAAWNGGRSSPDERWQWEIIDPKLGAKEASDWKLARPQLRLLALQSLRWRKVAGSESVLREALQDENPDVRLFAVRWIADERLDGFRDDVAKLLDGDIPTERYFLAVLAAIEWLDGDASPRASGISDGLLRRELANARRSPQIKALALRLISPDHEWLTIDRLREYLASDLPELQLEAVRTLAMQSRPERLAVLAEIAADASRDAELRAEAVVGLASAAGEYAELLEKLAAGDDVVAKEAARVLRLSGKPPSALEPAPPRPEPTDLNSWNTLLKDGGDAASGRRLFFTNQALCATCHQHSGRGGRIGPDLTRLGEQQSRDRIIASILQPSQEIAPHYQAWQLVTTDGLTREGLRLPEGGDDGTEPYADAQGQRFELRSEDIELRSPSPASIMPEGLAAGLTIEDLRDLAAFLSETHE